MIINEVLSTYLTNEEKALLNKLKEVTFLSGLHEREQVTINNLIRKSVVSTFVYNKQVMVIKNE